LQVACQFSPELLLLGVSPQVVDILDLFRREPTGSGWCGLVFLHLLLGGRGREQRLDRETKTSEVADQWLARDRRAPEDQLPVIEEPRIEFQFEHAPFGAGARLQADDRIHDFGIALGEAQSTVRKAL